MFCVIHTVNWSYFPNCNNILIFVMDPLFCEVGTEFFMHYVVEFLALKGYSGYIGQRSVILHVKM